MKNQVRKPSTGAQRQIIKDSTQYLTATIVGQGIGLIRAVILPILFSPAQMGIWNLMNVIFGYGGNAHVGLLDGMNKAIPFLRMKNDPEQVERIKDSVFWMNLLLGGFAGGAIWFVSWHMPGAYGVGMRITAGIVFLQLIFYYLFSLLRADNRFGLLSGGVAGLSVASTILILGGALGFQDRVCGALVGLMTAYGLIVVYWLLKSGYRFAVQFRFDAIRKALELGVPLIVIAFLSTIFMSVDRWMIAAWLDETQLGYYALGFMASNLLVLVPGSVASVLYPRMLKRFAVNDDPRAVRSFLMVPLRALVVLMLILISVAVVVLPLLIRLFVPKYLPSVPILMVLIPSAFFISLMPLAGNYLIAINRQRLIIAAQVIMTLFCLLADYGALKADYGVIGVAVVTAVGYLTLGLSITAIAVIHAEGQTAKTILFLFLARILLPFMLMILVIATMEWLIPIGGTVEENIVSAAVRLCILMIMLGPALWLANRDGELMAIIRSVHANRTSAESA